MTYVRNVPRSDGGRRSRNEMQGDRAVAAIAARRHGVVVLGDFLRAGLGRGAVAHRVATGRLTRLHRGVYLVGPLLGEWTREVAAVLAIGPDAALSHRSAAALWGIRPPWDGPVDVIVARKARRRPGIRLHRTTSLPADDVWERHGMRVTSPVRTLLDLATVLARSDLERALEQAEILRLLTPAQLHPRVRGVLRRILADAHEPAFTRSEAEARLLDLIRKARLPTPETNVRIGGYEVDFLWRDRKLVVEVDGFAYHSTREAFERDRRKDADLQALGLRTARVTFRQIATEPEATIARLSSMRTVQ